MDERLIKWIDELQAQIDALNRKVASVPAPDYAIIACGHAQMEITDEPIEGSNDNEFTRTAACTFGESFDIDNYDYYISFDYLSIHLSIEGSVGFYAMANSMALHDSEPLQGVVMPVLSTAWSQGTETCAVAGTVDVDFQYGESVTLSIVSTYGDGKCIADHGTSIDYMIVAKKKTETTTKKRKTKNRRK